MRTRASIKAGRIALNHNEGLVVRTALKAGRIALHHNEALGVELAWTGFRRPGLV